MTRRILLLAVLLVLGSRLAQAPAHALMSGPADLKLDMDSGDLCGLVFFDAGREVLVLQPSYFVPTAGKESALTDEGKVRGLRSLAWVVPLPAAPDVYLQVKPGCMQEVAAFARVRPRLEERHDDTDTGMTRTRKEDDVVQVSPVVETGDYNIRVIQATGEEGGKQLNAWLKDNGFPEQDLKVLRYYVREGFCWVVVTASVKDDLPPEGSIPPLLLSFKTKRPFYPLKIHDKRGRFDLGLWVVVKNALDLAKCREHGVTTPEQEDDYYLQERRETAFADLPESARALARDHEELKALREGQIFLYRFTGTDMEAEEGLDLGALQEDLYFEFAKDVAPKPKDDVKPTPPEGEKKPGESETKPEEGGNKKPAEGESKPGEQPGPGPK
ncbi:MAG: DUF2330 domain-containing protein [Planctomycetes bacterium]|nr:DUF2330 domain-containing protein [Planctomycetota bacterium]